MWRTHRAIRSPISRFHQPHKSPAKWSGLSTLQARQGRAVHCRAGLGWAVTGGVSGEDTFSRAKWTSSRWSQPSICDVATAPQKLLDKLHPTVTVLEWNINRLYTVSSCHICRISTPWALILNHLQEAKTTEKSWSLATNSKFNATCCWDVEHPNWRPKSGRVWTTGVPRFLI